MSVNRAAERKSWSDSGSDDPFGPLLQECEARYAVNGERMDSPNAPPPASADCPLTFREFVTLVRPKYRWFKHCEVLAAVLQRVADGELKKVMIFLPPRHGKSEEVSRLFSAYFLYRYPERWVAISSYAADLAYTLSRAAKENYLEGGGPISASASAVKHWETGKGGGLWACGAAGPATGKGWHLGIIDDPIKNAEDAASPKLREKLKEWYRSTWSTREEPWSDTDSSGAEIIIQTRWSTDDLAGWQLSLESETAQDDEDASPSCWHIVNLPAIAEEEPQTFPATCTVEPDWRNPGEPLCPERRPLAKLKSLAKRIGSYFFSALFQQRPVPLEGMLLKRAFFARTVTLDQVPPLVNSVFGVDLAVSAKTSADFTVGFPMGVDAENIYYLFPPARGQWEPADARRNLITRIKNFKQASVVGVESVAALSGYVTEIRNEPQLAGYTILDIGRHTDKVLLCSGWQPIAEQKRIVLVDDGSGWIERFLTEAESFPLGKNDDQVDTVGICFETLRNMGQGQELTFC